ncbi:hypothetical protein [Halogeometricum luteum]|uniref:Uncharacterized protein n=1 Tax=Halogeometricum luteum TaxID=2950537 RepID=A0ABU2G617_9EURY|nr:hypothetical protein [Halogeometricum sp. S3BR5-2]MDS0295744.1 hypothetical protein [Halogeometricum sp. S3BR5-2]
MSLGTCFDLLSRIVERYESEGGSVRAVETTTDDDRAVRATITVSAAVLGSAGGQRPTLVAESASVDDEGGVEVSFSASNLADVVEHHGASVDADVRGASSTDDGELVLTVGVVIEPLTDASGMVSTDDADAETDVGADGTQLAAGESSDSIERTAENGVEAFGGGDGTGEDRTEADERGGDGPTASPSAAEELAAVRDESVLPCEDVEYLERLYERCETFTEMTRLIEMDVTSETVRRYMIEADIHSPTTYDTVPRTEESESGESQLREPGTGEPDGPKPESDPSTAQSTVPDSSGTDPDEEWESEEDSSSEPSPDAVGAEKLVTDGIGLPNSVQIPDVVDAVTVSVTLYGFARRLDLEQEDARELLRQLDLLDFVPRRLPAGRRQEISHEDVAEQIRRSAGSA